MAIPTPLVFFNFDEASGNATDAVNALSGVNTSVTYSTGKINNASYYNGSAFLTVADNALLEPVNAISFGGWIYVSSTSSFQMVMAKGENAGDTRSYEMRMNGTTTKPEVQMRVGASFVQARGDTNIGTGAWKHVMYTRNGTTHNIYVDGVAQTLEASITQSGNITYNTDPLWFGQRNGGLRFNGRQDMMGIWDVELTSSEVGELYNAGAGIQYPFGGGGGGSPTPLLSLMGVGS